MKYLKKFEQYTKNDIEIGDFIIVSPSKMGQKKFTKLLSGIGIVKKIYNDIIIVEYDTNIEDGFLSTKTLIRIKYNEIIHSAKTKDELEIKLASNKYNL